MQRYKVTIIVAALTLLTGCASTQHAKDVQPSGFLGASRALLRPGQEGEEALRVYRNPKANWAAYTKILLEPVTIWGASTSTLSPTQREDLQRLADSFSAMLYQKLSQDYEMVTQPGPGAMRVQAAITHGEEAQTGLTVASKAILPGAGGERALDLC